MTEPAQAVLQSSLSVNQSWKDIAGKILSAQQIVFPEAGVTIDWAGAARTLKIEKNRITISPSARVTAKKWVFSYSVGLIAVDFMEDLSSMTLELSGAPDITIQLVSK